MAIRKQAIYGFRGADVLYLHLAAAGKVDRRYTLDRNWRSETGLIDAVNTLFELETNPFLLDGITFERVEAAGEADRKAPNPQGEKTPPFQLWLSEEAMTTTDAAPVLVKILASEIVRVLQSSAKIGDRPIVPRDLAILVGANREAQMIQEELRQRRGADSHLRRRECFQVARSERGANHSCRGHRTGSGTHSPRGPGHRGPGHNE